MDIYRHFARVYDVFMTNTPYSRWAGYIDEIYKNYNVPENGLVLDLACGTGTMTLLMAQKGYEMIGVDASADMLSEAYDKIYKKAPAKGILFLNQDMKELELYGTVDAAYCVCDSLNYILEEEELGTVFKKIALYLNPGGIFVFDMKTVCKYRQMGNNSYLDSVGTYSYLWKNSYNNETSINEYHVRFFVKEGESHNKSFFETHHQRGYSVETVAKTAQKAGLMMLAVCDNYTCNPVKPDSERYTFISQKEHNRSVAH